MTKWPINLTIHVNIRPNYNKEFLNGGVDMKGVLDLT